MLASSKRRFRPKLYAFAAVRVPEAKFLGVEHHAGVVRGVFGIERVAEDRVADLFHMHAELVGTAGFRDQPHAAFATADLHAGPVRDGLFPGLEIDVLQGAVGPVDNKGQVHGAGLLSHFAVDAGDVGFLGLTFLELQAQVALCGFGLSKDHDAGRVAVEAVDQERGRKRALHAGDEAIGQVLPFPGNRQQAGGFVHHD